jgi:hypothetical protein
MPVPGRNLLGFTVAFDNNIIGSQLSATRFSARLHREGCIAIVVSDDVFWDGQLEQVHT